MRTGILIFDEMSIERKTEQTKQRQDSNYKKEMS